MSKQISVICLPPYCTVVIQHMDQNVIRLTKLNYMRSFKKLFEKRCNWEDEDKDSLSKLRSQHLNDPSQIKTIAIELLKHLNYHEIVQ